MKEYCRPAAAHEIELEIKRSRFLGLAMPVENTEDAQQQLAVIRAAHPHANHHCWARISGRPDEVRLWDSSDDGEPRGTAGRPMLQILQHSGLGQIQVVVVRYFGGVKLGTGGLVRAYGQSVNEVLATLSTEVVEARVSAMLSVPHHMTGELEGMIRQLQLPVVERYWQDNFRVEFSLKGEELAQLQQALGRFAGQYQLQLDDD
ncbi:MAG: YigZ family protein [Marinobacterium sp.]|nr:YigZ family protein [Marinobacterium sp.]